MSLLLLVGDIPAGLILLKTCWHAVYQVLASEKRRLQEEGSLEQADALESDLHALVPAIKRASMYHSFIGESKPIRRLFNVNNFVNPLEDYGIPEVCLSTAAY